MKILWNVKRPINVGLLFCFCSFSVVRRVYAYVDSSSSSSDTATNPHQIVVVAGGGGNADGAERSVRSYSYRHHSRPKRVVPPATSIPRFRKYAVDDFNFLKVLGKGSFGKVRRHRRRGVITKIIILLGRIIIRCRFSGRGKLILNRRPVEEKKQFSIRNERGGEFRRF